MALLIGGVSFKEQEGLLQRGVDVLIATPGRLLDQFDRGKLLLMGVEYFIIDEADRMLDMGFIPDIERICRLVPFTRQTLFFSATMSPEIQRLTGQFLQNPVQVQVRQQGDDRRDGASGAGLVAVDAEGQARDAAAAKSGPRQNLTTAIVFCNRKRDVSDRAPFAATARLRRRRSCTAISISASGWRHSPSSRPASSIC